MNFFKSNPEKLIKNIDFKKTISKYSINKKILWCTPEQILPNSSKSIINMEDLYNLKDLIIYRENRKKISNEELKFIKNNNLLVFDSNNFNYLNLNLFSVFLKILKIIYKIKSSRIYLIFFIKTS